MKHRISCVTVRYRPQRRLVFDKVAQCSVINSLLVAHFLGRSASLANLASGLSLRADGHKRVSAAGAKQAVDFRPRPESTLLQPARERILSSQFLLFVGSFRSLPILLCDMAKHSNCIASAEFFRACRQVWSRCLSSLCQTLFDQDRKCNVLFISSELGVRHLRNLSTTT